MTTVAALALQCMSPALAAPSCGELCKIPSVDDKTVVVDVTQQKIVKGPSTFGTNVPIQVLLQNKNPFRYEYSLSVETTFPERDTLKAGLTALGLPLPDFDGTLKAAAADAPKAPPAAGNGGPGPAGVAPRASACDTALSDFTSTLLQAYTDRQTALDNATVAAKTLNDAKTKVTDFNKAVVDSNIMTSACNTLCGPAQLAVEGLAQLLQPSELQRQLTTLTELKKTVGDIPANAEQALKRDNKQCPRELNGLSQQSRDFVSATSASMAAFEKLAAELKESNNAYKAAREDLQGTLASPTAFNSIEIIPANSEAVVHKVSLLIKDRINTKEPARVVPLGELKAGRPALTFSVGPGLSLIDQREFGRQAGMVPDGSGGTTLGSIVAVTDESDTKLAFVGQLNARVYDIPWENSGIHLSFGAAIGSGESDSDIGLFLGPSFSLRNELVFLTFAYHYQETRKLGGNFRLGDTVPAELEGELPTTTKRVGGLLLTLTIKMR